MNVYLCGRPLHHGNGSLFETLFCAIVTVVKMAQYYYYVT